MATSFTLRTGFRDFRVRIARPIPDETRCTVHELCTNLTFSCHSVTLPPRTPSRCVAPMPRDRRSDLTGADQVVSSASGAPAFGVKNLNVADSALLTLERLSLTIQFVFRLSPPSGSRANGGPIFVVFPAFFFAQ